MYLRPHKNGWRAEVVKNGRRASKVFDRKSDAKTWGVRKEAEFSGRRKPGANKTLRDALDRYGEEVSPTKKGERWELLRMTAWRGSMPFVDEPLDRIDSTDIAEWRNHRLKGVTASTVQRDLNLLRAVLNVAKSEWKWIDASPMEGVQMPGQNKARTRRVEPSEARAICRALGYSSKAPENASQAVALAFLIGLRTAMRAGEILGLQRSDVDLQARVASLRDTKNGEDRDVPLTRAGARLLGLACEGKTGALFTLNAASRDALFRRAKRRTGLLDLNFHDSRAEALTRLSRKVDVLTLSRISGHKDVNLLARVYYRESASSIAARL